MKFAALLYGVAASAAAFAMDDGVVLHCERDKQQLRIEHVLERKPPEFWSASSARVLFLNFLKIERCDPADRHSGDPCAIQAKRTVTRSCVMGKDSFTVRVRPEPFNEDLQGQCGAKVTASLEIWRNGEVVLPWTTLDGNFSDCASDDVTVVKSITLKRDGATIEVNRAPSGGLFSN